LADLVDFALTTRAHDDGGTFVALAGELDLYRVPALADALRAASGSVVVDLQGVTFLDSATLALLVHEHRRLRAAGRELTVLVGEQTPTTVFAITGIDQILTIRSTEPPSHDADSRAA
jgi:anti-sigma B factor antagonist